MHTIVDSEDGKLSAPQVKGMKDKITVTETTCASVVERFSYLACRPVNGIGGGQHSVVSIVLLHFVRSNFPRARREAHGTQAYIPSSMNKYNCTAIKYAHLLRIARHETPQSLSLLINTQHYSSRLQYAAYGGRRRLSRQSSIL